MEKFDYAGCLEGLSGVVGIMKLNRAEHEHMVVGIAKLRERLVECDRLEAAAEISESQDPE